jgi:hypothetical protein
MRHPAMLTLTVPNVLDANGLPLAVERLVKGFERLRRRAVWPKGVRGFWSLEVTWSAAKGYHPHLHVILEFPWVDLAGLAREWTALTGAKHQPDLQRAEAPGQRAGLLKEAIKYVLKPGCFDSQALRVVLALLHGRRAFNGFGGLRMAGLEDPDKPLVCPKCHAPFCWPWRRVAGRWMAVNDDWHLVRMSAAEVRLLKIGPYWPDVFDGWKPRGP